MLIAVILVSFLSLLQTSPTSGRPDSLQTLLVKAGIALNHKEYAKARDYYDAAYQLDSNNVETIRNLALLCSTAGDHPHALELLKRAQQLAPEDPSLYNNLGTAYSAMGKTDSAISSFEKALSLRPEDPTFMVNLAIEYSRIGRMQEAATMAHLAMNKDTLAVDPPMVLGDYFMQQRRYDSADVYFTKAVALGVNTPTLYYRRGLARQNLKRLGEAEDDLKTAIKRDSTCRDCRQGLGVLYVTRGQYQDALEQFEQVVRLDSTFNNGWVSLGVMYAMTGQGAKADSVLYRLMAIDTSLGYRMVDLIQLENSKQQKK